MIMDKGLQLLSDVTVYHKYARYLPALHRRETWEEICYRSQEMHCKRYPRLKTIIERVFQNYVVPKLVLPSMRSLQFAGKPIELAPNRIMNCAALPLDHVKAFREIMFLLLGGTGVGFSVQECHIRQLPRVRAPDNKVRYLIQDSIIGWAEAVNALVSAYLCGTYRPVFDYSDIRPAGTLLKTTGGRAPGHEGLQKALENMERLLSAVPAGNRLTPIQCHDLVCYMAEAVRAGGIRRSALISLFDFDDMEMRAAKTGEFWVDNGQRIQANNSAMALRHRITRKDFQLFMNTVYYNKTGEPGIYFANDYNSLTNPCAEASVNLNFCNLTTVNMSTVQSQAELFERVGAATLIGTLQAGYTNFHYLRPVWQERTEQEALLGVSMTGLARDDLDQFDFAGAAQFAVRSNKYWAKKVGINPAYRVTVNKPEGSSSAVLGTSSGVHPWHSQYGIRNTRYGKDTPLVKYLQEVYPAGVQPDKLNPNEVVLSIPFKAPDNAVLRNEPMSDFLERVRLCSKEWVKPGHGKGHNGHSVSATVSVMDEDQQTLIDWMWSNRYHYNGLSVLPYDDSVYQQAPFVEITKEQYDAYAQALPDDIDLTKIKEDEDTTERQAEVSCAGGACVV